MKRFVRIVCLIMVFSMLAAIPVYAQEQSPWASSYFTAYRAYCTKTSSTSLTVSFEVLGVGMMDEIGANTIKVQYSSDQTNWTTAKTFTKSSYTSMTDTNTGSHAAELSCTVPSGKYYRAYVEFYAEKNGGYAERYYYTGII